MEVAEMVGKDHKELLRDVRKYVENLGEVKIDQSDFFQESTYQNSQNKTQPCFAITKKGCEFIGNKLTGTKGTQFTAKYINKFHEMEYIISKPVSALDELNRLLVQGVVEVNERVDAVDKKVEDFKKDLPMLAVDCDAITKAVKRKGTLCLGGHSSNAYKDNSVRTKVYSDIHREIKRQFGVDTYKEIKRVNMDKVLLIVESYSLPLVLESEISDCNRQLSLAV